mgnify:CR=1 FL=1
MNVVSTSHQAQTWGVLDLLSTVQTSMWCTTLSWWMYMATPGASRKSSSSSSAVAGGVSWALWFGPDWVGCGPDLRQLPGAAKEQSRRPLLTIHGCLCSLGLLVIGPGVSQQQPGEECK